MMQLEGITIIRSFWGGCQVKAEDEEKISKLNCRCLLSCDSMDCLYYQQKCVECSKNVWFRNISVMDKNGIAVRIIENKSDQQSFLSTPLVRITAVFLTLIGCIKMFAKFQIETAYQIATKQCEKCFFYQFLVSRCILSGMIVAKFMSIANNNNQLKFIVFLFY